jgi:hypothetical protein
MLGFSLIVCKVQSGLGEILPEPHMVMKQGFKATLHLKISCAHLLPCDDGV